MGIHTFSYLGLLIRQSALILRLSPSRPTATRKSFLGLGCKSLFSATGNTQIPCQSAGPLQVKMSGRSSLSDASERIQIIHKDMRKDRRSSEVTASRGGDVGKPAESPVTTPSEPPALPTPQSETKPAVFTNKEPAFWIYPRVAELLVTYGGETRDSAADTEWLKQVENSCKGALQQFQLQSKLLSGALTPNAALLKFQGSATLTVEQVLRKRSEFLTTHKLNVISVWGQTRSCGYLPIARPNRRVLQLPEVLEKKEHHCAQGNHRWY